MYLRVAKRRGEWAFLGFKFKLVTTVTSVTHVPAALMDRRSYRA